MQRIGIVFMTCCLLVALVRPGAALAEDSVLVAGWVEQVLVSSPLEESSVAVAAKLDTGALTSSLHAEEVREDEQKGLVHFLFVTDDGSRVPMTCPFVRHVRIKRRPDGYQRRTVVAVRLRLGGKVLDTEMNLTDRSNFNYRLLVGRRDLAHGVLVDASRKNVLRTIRGSD
ncbi:ATP-dependent zinc protease [Pseudodesulfovibrio tunisiensis]|uniref:ATP-dependent zinc protease family protein n=1 Tax=Pseudodesulfovibrio tunisiensis TaxID=463192 RepID=UPI001FB1BC1F|nr:RimK/LysX family protein [Pseudodesulfovibrio tunisiensis]